VAYSSHVKGLVFCEHASHSKVLVGHVGVHAVDALSTRPRREASDESKNKLANVDRCSAALDVRGSGGGSGGAVWV